MLSRVVPFARTLSSVSRLQITRSMGSVPAHFKTDREIDMETRATMNDLPVPEGPWLDNYNKKNARLNIMFGGSVVCFIATFYMMMKVGCFKMYGCPPLKN